LGHVYYAEINPVLSELLKINQDKDLIRKYIDFIEDMINPAYCICGSQGFSPVILDQDFYDKNLSVYSEKRAI